MSVASMPSLPTDKLPRGPHSLSRAEVGSSQRSRLLLALVEIAAAEGIEGTRIGDVCRRAGVSNSAFYAQFDGKGDALLAAYDAIAAEVTEAVVATRAEATPWRDVIRAGVAAYLGVLDRSPAAARLFIVESAAAPPAVRARRLEAHREFARLVRTFHDLACRQEPRLDASLSDRVYVAATEGIVGLIASHLEDIDSDPVTVLEDDLVAFLVAFVEGAGHTS